MNRHRTKYLLLIVVTALGFIIANSNYQFQFELVHAGDWETVEYIQGVQDLNFVPAATGDDYVDYVQTSVYGGWQNAPPYGMALDSAGPAGDSHLIELSYTETTYPTKTSYTGGSLPSGWSNTYWTFGASYASILGWSYTFGYFTTNTHDMTSYLAVRIKFSWCNYGGENTDLGDLFIRSYEGSYQTVYQTPAGYRVQFLAITVDRAWHSTGWKVQFYATDLDQGAETCEGFKLDNIYLQGKQSSTYWRFQAVLGFSNVDYHWDKVTLYVDFYTALTGSDDLDFRIETGDVTPDYLVADNKQNDFSVDVSAYVTGTTVYLDIRDDYRTGDTVQTYAYIQRCYLKLENTAPANDGVPTISNPDDTDNLYSRLTKYEVTTYHKDVDGFGDIDYVLFMVYDEEWGTMYFYGKFIQDSHEFSELAGYTGNWELDLAGSTYSEHDTDELDITWKFYVEWECADITDMNVRPYVVDESGLIDNDWNAMTWDVETDLEYDVVPTITDDDAGDADRGDPDETFHITGDVSYQGSSLTPPSGDVDVMVACTAGDYGTNGGPWEDDTVDAGGTFDVTCYADDEVGIETYTIRVVKEGTGYGGTDLVIGADPTDTYIADQIEIIWFVASDNRTNIGTAIEIRVKAIYDYNDAEVSTGTITLNGTYSATWDAGNSWFDYTTSAYSTVGARCFNITAAIDSAYGVTGWVWHTGVNPSQDNNYLTTNVKDPWKLQTFTVEHWFMSTNLKDVDVYPEGAYSTQVAWRNYNGGTNGGFLLPYRNAADSSTLLRWYAIYNLASGQTSTYKHTYHTEGVWYHGIYSVNSTGYCWLYINGELQYAWQAPNFVSWCYINPTNGYIAGDWGYDYNMHVDEVRFHNVAFDADRAYEAYHGIHTTTGLVSYWPMDGNFTDVHGIYDCSVVGTGDPISHGEPVSIVWDSMMVSYSLDESREDVGFALRVTATISYAFDQWAVTGLTTTWSPSGSVTDVGDGTYYVDYTKNYVFRQDTYLATISGDAFGLTEIGDIEWDGVNDYLKIDYDASLKPTTAITMCAWVYLDSYIGTWASVIQYPYMPTTHVSPYFEWAIYIQNTGAIHTRIDGESSGAYGTAVTTGAWHFVAIVWDGSTTLVDYYVDGESVGQFDGTKGSIPYDNDNPVYIGTNAAQGEDLDGHIALIRCYSRAIASWELLEIMAGHYGDDTGLFLSLDRISVDVEESVWNDSSGNNNDADFYNDVRVSADPSNLRAWPIWDALAFDIYIDNDRYDLTTEDVTITCKAIYAYDGTTFTDAGGSTLTFLTFGAATYSGGLWTDSGANGYIALGNYYVSAFTDEIYGLTKITSGFYFAGTDDHLEIPHDSSQTAISDFTIEGWFYPMSSAESKVIIAKAYGASRQFMVWWLSTSQISLVYKNTTYFNIGCSPTGLALNTWHHFVITIDNYFNLNSWYDGIHYLTDYTMAESLIQRDVQILIGAREYSGNDFTQDFIGYISHLRMYSRALTDDECYAHYQRHYESDTDLVFALTGSGLRGNAGTYGQWIDSTANNNDATAYNGAAMFQNSGGNKRIRPIWDTVSWEIWVDAGRVNAGVDTVRVWFDAVYAYDGSAFEGSVTIEGNAMTPSGGAWYYDIPAQSVGRYTWDTIDITDTRFELNDQQAGMYFDGSDDYATIADSAALNTNQDYSISVWFYVSGAGTAGKIYWTIASKNDIGYGTNDPWHFWVVASTSMAGCRFGDGGGATGNCTELSTGVNVIDSQWHMITLTYDYSENLFSLYLDGVLKSTFDTDTDGSWKCGDNSNDIRIGEWGPYNNHLNGYISEILHWSRTLTDAEVFLLYAGQYSTVNLEMRIDGLSYQYKETYEMADRIASHDLNFVGPRIYDLNPFETALPVWDQIRVVSYTIVTPAGDNRNNIGTTYTIDIELHYDFDETDVIVGTVTMNGLSTSYQSLGKWRFTDSWSSVNATTFNNVQASGNTYGITVEDNTVTQLIIWDAIGINMWIDDDRDDVNDTITIYAWLTYLYDRTNVTDGTILLNGTGMSYSSQIWSLGRSQSTVGLWAYNITSISGNTHGITVIGEADFDTTYVELTDDNGFPAGNSSRTITAWVYPRSYPQGLNHIFHYGNNVGGQSWGIVIHNTDGFGPHEWGIYQFVGGSVPLNEWIFLVITMDAEGVKLHYMNGEYVGTLTYVPNTVLSDTPKVGSRVLLGEYFDGYIGEIQLYSRVLSSGEIFELYQGRYSNDTGLVFRINMASFDVEDDVWHDLSGNSNNGTIVNAVAGEIEGSLYVRPIWDQIEITYFIGDSFGYNFNFELGTLEGWTIQTGSPYITSAASHGDVIHFDGDGTYHRVISNGLIPCSEGDVFKAELWYNASSGSLGYFGMYFVGVGWQYFFAYPSMTRDGTWYYKSGVSVTAPAGATYAQVWLFNYVGNTGALEYDDIYIWSDDVAMRCSTSDTATYRAKARLDYDNHDLGAGDSFTIDGISFTWDSDLGLFTGTASSGTVQAIIYDAFDVGSEATYGITVGTMAGFNITQIYDELIFDIQADDESPDTGVTVTFTITVTFSYDSSTCSYWNVTIQRDADTGWGTFNWLSTIQDMESTPQSHDYLAYSAWEMAFNINDIDTTNTETVTWYNQYPVNVSLSVDYDDTDNCYARYRYYLITFTVSDGDGYGNIQTVQIALFESTRTTMYWAINYTQATDTFTEAYGGSKIVLAGWTYDSSAGNQIILYIYIKVEWSHGELTDADFRGYVIDDVAESDLDWYDENAEVVCTLDYTVTPTVTDAVADGTRGDISGSITGAGTVIYYGSGDNYPLANETDVWILHDVSGTWSDDVDGSGAFNTAMTANNSVRESTYTIKVVIQGDGSGGTDLYYTTTVTDTYISDSLTITITDPTDPEQRIDLNVNATGIVVSAVYDYDGATYDGTFVLNSTTFSYATVGKRGYTVSSASGDDSFGIAAISTNNETYCIWDEMLVLYILADDDVSYFGQTVNFTVGLQYKYDSDNVQTGTFSLEALALAFSAGANWTTSESHGTSGTWLYNDVTGTDGAYSLTGIDMDSNTLSVVWDTIVISASLNYDWTIVGYNLTITTTGTFEHLGYTWNGTPTWSGTDYPEESTIGNYTYTLNSITEPDYGVTTFTNDPTLWAIFDTVNCSRSALYWKNTLDADWLYLDTAAFFFGFNESGLTENFKIQSYYGYPDASTSSDYAYVNDHSQIDRLIIGNFSGAGMDTINASYSAVCTILGEPEYRIWSYDMSYLDVRNVVYEDTVFVDAGARAYILNNEEVRNQIHIVLYNNSMIAGSYAEDGTSIWVRILAYRDGGFPTKNQIWTSTKGLSTNMDGTVVWSLRNWDAWNICNKWNTATSPFIYIHYSTVSSGGPWTFINAFHALGSNYNLDPYNDATWTVDLERSQVLVESDWSPDRENLTAWMESDGLTPYGYGEFANYEWINAENWNRYVWEALVTIWADFGAPIGGPAPMGEFQYVIDRRPIDPIPLGIILMPLTGWQRASGVDDISYFWLDVFPQWAFWYEEDGQWYQTGDYDISLWLRTRLENNILWSPWYQKLSDPNNYETGQHLQENLMLPFDYRNTELSIAGERVALSGDITFSFDYTIYENDVDVGSGSVNITPTLNVWSQFAIYWDRQQGTGNVNYSIYCDTTAYESWSAQSLWINGTYSKAEPPSGFTIEQFEVEYDDVYVNIYCETNWANSTLYLYVDGSLKATSAEADIIQYRKSMTEGTHSLNILIDAGSETRWRNYTYAIGVDAITLKIIEFEWDTGSPNTYSCFVRTNWGNATVRLLEDGNTRFMQTEVGKGMSFKLSKVQRFGVHTVTLQIDAGGQILTYVLGYSYREPDHPSDTPDVGPMLAVIGDELSDSLEDKIVIHPALIGFFVSTAFMAVIILIIVFKWLLKEPIL